MNTEGNYIQKDGMKNSHKTSIFRRSKEQKEQHVRLNFNYDYNKNDKNEIGQNDKNEMDPRNMQNEENIQQEKQTKDLIQKLQKSMNGEKEDFEQPVQ